MKSSGPEGGNKVTGFIKVIVGKQSSSEAGVPREGANECLWLRGLMGSICPCS